VRLDCAECHDHPFAAWKQSDFEGLAAFFGGTRQSLRGIRDVPGEFEVENRQTGEVSAVAPGVPFGREWLPARGGKRERLASWVTHDSNRAFAREAANRAWALMFGRPLVEPIDDLPIEGEFPQALEILADDFIAHDYDFRRMLEVIASTRAFRLDSARDVDDLDENGRQEYERAWAAFPLTRLRPEQVIGAVLQSASLATIDYDSNILVRIARFAGQNEFVERYGDSGADEFEPHGGTTPQRLLMMNGDAIHGSTRNNLLGNAASQIAALAPDDATAVETALLAVLTRRPTQREATHFAARLEGASGDKRKERLGDLYWSLLNTTEFSWNH
jgi:hypothetical protein